MDDQIFSLFLLGEVVMMNESDKDKLKELHSTRSFTVWHDHSDICGKASINTESVKLFLWLL